MRKRWRVAAVATILVASGAVFGQTGGKYNAAGIARGGDIPYPVNTSITGMVTLEVSVGADGGVQKVQTVTDTPPLTNAATHAVKNWKYFPAMLDGVPVAGIVDAARPRAPAGPAVRARRPECGIRKRSCAGCSTR